MFSVFFVKKKIKSFEKGVDICVVTVYNVYKESEVFIMTFSKFEELVKEKRPNATVFKHGEFAGNKINVAIIFNGEHGKVYQYNGTYCEVLNRLGVKAIYKHDYNALVSALERYKKMNGTPNIFSGVIVDYSRKIEEYTNRLNDVNANYVIV